MTEQFCGECGNDGGHPMHGEWKLQYTGKVDYDDLHDFEAGCYCGGRNRCTYCVDRLVDQADFLRKAAKEND